MKVVSLVAENFKILRAIEITPEGNVITIGGENDQGKSSVLDSIWVALKGMAAAPPKPIRDGEEECRIMLDLGELTITRVLRDKGDGKITHTVKVESADGLRHPSPQTVLDSLLGAIGFDPFEFTKLKADVQAERLLELVPLPIDLDEHAALDDSDFAKRRDVNRDIEQLKGQLAGLPKETVPEDIPDRDALVAKLGEAANVNIAIERETDRRFAEKNAIARILDSASVAKERAEHARQQAEELEQQAAKLETDAADREKDLNELPPVDDPVDTAAVREEIRMAENAIAIRNRQSMRADLEVRLAGKNGDSEQLTANLKAREKEREEALAKAKMPIDGLGFVINEKGKPVVTFNGQPFEQASTAQQIRASTAIAMASNPQLRVLRIKDGSLLSPKSMAMIAEMAAEQDFQIWCEVVGTGGVGVVIENGAIVVPELEKADG